MMNVQAGRRVGGLTETASSDRAEFRTDRGHRRRGPDADESAQCETTNLMQRRNL
jgi:hypothetical protein